MAANNTTDPEQLATALELGANGPCAGGELCYCGTFRSAAAIIRAQAERIKEVEREIVAWDSTLGGMSDDREKARAEALSALREAAIDLLRARDETVGDSEEHVADCERVHDSMNLHWGGWDRLRAALDSTDKGAETPVSRIGEHK